MRARHDPPMFCTGSNFGLPGIIITSEHETYDRVRIEAEPGIVLCPECRSADGLNDGEWARTVEIADTPSRGRPTKLIVKQRRYRCSPCAKSFIATVDGINNRREMTDRLIRYIENEAPRRPKKAIAEMVGVGPDRVDRLVSQLATNLARHHRFPTPEILAIDDIKLNGLVYHLFTDSETGYPVGLVEAGDGDALLKWATANLDASRVSVLVTDLGGAPLKLGRSASFAHVLHVADRWHLIRGCQKAMVRVIRQELAKLDLEAAELKKQCVLPKSNEPARKATLVRSLRRELLGRRRGRRQVEDQTLYDERALAPILDGTTFPRIRSAFYTRIAFARVHRAPDQGAARDQLSRFYAAASHDSVRAEFAAVVQTIRSHEPYVFRYFDAVGRHPDVSPAAFTTSSTERRNGKLRKSWKAGRGVRSYPYLRLLALYEPWRFDVDIVRCAETGCVAIEGPVHLIPGLRGQNPDAAVLPRSAFRCRMHALSADVHPS